MPKSIPLASRFYEPVVDQHESWIAVNPRQGCPKNCGYCYLKDRGQTLVKPVEVATPKDTVAQLLASPYYHRDAVLALYTCTDALATPPNRAHLIKLLHALAAECIPNPVCLITKCAFTPEVLTCLETVQRKGLRVIVYLSYSGLGPDVEQGIDHDALRANFPALHHIGTPVIHYWRPFLPTNSTPEAVTRVLDHVTQYARCSVAIGLKVKPGGHELLTGLWPELADNAKDDVERASSVWPEQMRAMLPHLPDTYGDYPIYETNTCALSYVLDQPDRFHILGSTVCEKQNHCPAAQRALCERGESAPPVNENTITAHLEKLGVTQVRWSWDPASKTLTFLAPIPTAPANNLAQTLRIRVRTAANASDHYWTGKVTGSVPLMIPDNRDI
ncbi:hypothetical protein STTU_5112 [Streptomyces sp. Tu6071]|uniref:hypothetical protein n=1 Tax=Streptomyces sp. Tu6071 TaxID=355249 RepID=UPI00020E61C3|nr:hypothetical protein [Streptomyces sp. Tu6071]EGJ77901.1 hypothetical protein STTU_5112 [Streptomyces sp. Tu6071]